VPAWPTGGRVGTLGMPRAPHGTSVPYAPVPGAVPRVPGVPVLGPGPGPGPGMSAPVAGAAGERRRANASGGTPAASRMVCVTATAPALPLWLNQ